MERNRIEREIFITAPLDRVWSLVNEPAWWVGDAPGPNQVHVDGNRVLAETKYGNFPVVIERVDAPTYIACRWASSFPGEEPREGNSTLVEFTLIPEAGGTRLRVVESGFASLDASENGRHQAFDENTKGWSIQLDVLRQHAEELSV
ncbi:SRPBCC domain-containing protein [Alicyclobacillus dauci]|uniref:SRPBCC domain-containing protein n=1 Tax=Alicyclobacillus dauci TaxID=1475485 RepID=A0ABY6Z0X5_9BACL|nr:SRPBCC domain-containing protein [Alicyclobacillus dauci]WAH36529.1 SRPBCC domain-containing protein [Alicyclobacillus dauci]